ncbi:hypothetical protein [Metasolibacillus sp.]|uniref:hypothetical protein n=1 Tax=Metasolibacillus sp. TaxID=2703680 RepID=UPI0025CD90AD|nr:hypothetical protein [Metasolibacillus sp.]MCT6926338.1 hypothetical protein [Metasolibacillus sp.]
MINYVTYLGYNGPAPLAIILWYKPNRDKPSYRTICFDEGDVINMYERYTTPSDMYSKLKPSIHIIEPIEIKTAVRAS